MPFDAGLAGDGESLELRLLRQARRTLSDPKRWIRARLWDDWDCTSPAVRGCAVGHLAFAAATLLGHGPAVSCDNARAVAARCLAPLISADMVMWTAIYGDDEYERVTSYNDHHTTRHADILALFDRAIAREAAKQEVMSDAV